MRRLATFLKFAFFAIVILPFIDKSIGAQERKPPALNTIQVHANEGKLDPSLDWISEYSPPFIYQVWWSDIAQCEGLPLPMEKVARVRFFLVNAREFIPLDVDAIVLAITYGKDEQVFAALPFIWNKALIEHEMLHLLLIWSGDPNWGHHDPVRFMSCGLRIGGPPPPNT